MFPVMSKHVPVELADVLLSAFLARFIRMQITATVAKLRTSGRARITRFVGARGANVAVVKVVDVLYLVAHGAFHHPVGAFLLDLFVCLHGHFPFVCESESANNGSEPTRFAARLSRRVGYPTAT
jgi:hypothetical protein